MKHRLRSRVILFSCRPQPIFALSTLINRHRKTNESLAAEVRPSLGSEPRESWGADDFAHIREGERRGDFLLLRPVEASVVDLEFGKGCRTNEAASRMLAFRRGAYI